MRIIGFIWIVFSFVACKGSSEEATSNPSDTVAIDTLSWFNQQIQHNPTNLTILKERGKFHLRNASVDLAQHDFELLLKMDSTDLEVHKYYADIMLSKLVLEKTKYHLEYIIKRDSLNAEAFTGMGKLYALLDNNAAAIAYLNKSLSIDPYQTEPYFMKGMIYRSDFQFTGRQESWDLALSSFQTAIEQDPDNYSAYVQLGVMYDQAGDSSAVDYYNSALDIFPQSLEAWYNKAMFYQNRGQVPEAFDCYRTINKIDSTWADPYYNMGYIHLVMLKQPDSAIVYLDKATKADPLFYQAYNNLGLAYEELGDEQGALFFYMKAVEINPDYKLAKENLNRLQ